MSDILSAVLEDIASDLGLIVQLPPPPTSPSIDSLSLAEPHSPSTTASASPSPTPSRKRSHSPSSSSLFTPPATPRTPQFLTPHSKRIRATSSSSPHSSSAASQVTPVKADVDLLLMSLARRSPRLNGTPSRPLSELLTSGGGWEARAQSAAGTPKPRGHSQQSKLIKPFLTPQPMASHRHRQTASSATSTQPLERRRHSDGSRLSSKRYQAALSLHAPASSIALHSSSTAVFTASGSRVDHLEVPVATVRRSPPVSSSNVRDSARSSKVLFGYGG